MDLLLRDSQEAQNKCAHTHLHTLAHTYAHMLERNWKICSPSNNLKTLFAWWETYSCGRMLLWPVCGTGVYFVTYLFSLTPYRSFNVNTHTHAHFCLCWKGNQLAQAELCVFVWFGRSRWPWLVHGPETKAVLFTTAIFFFKSQFLTLWGAIQSFPMCSIRFTRPGLLPDVMCTVWKQIQTCKMCRGRATLLRTIWVKTDKRSSKVH